MSAIYNRQNDETGMMYLRASKYCQQQKLKVTYYMIVVSLLVTLASIAVRILANITAKNGFALSPIYSQAVVVISGVVLVSNIFCSFLEHEFNTMSVNLLERYDIHVFNLPINKALLRPIAEQTIVNYARKFRRRKKVLQLRNYYFKTPEQAEQKNVSFSNIKKTFQFSHRLLIDVHSVFIFLWMSYVVLIFVIAFTVSSQDSFIETVINIFVPALSTISLIASAWRRYNEQSRKLSNCVNITGELAIDAMQKNSVSLQSQYTLRCLQDALFNLRINDFTIPEFMVKKFNKKLAREEEIINQEAYTGIGFSKKPTTAKPSKNPDETEVEDNTVTNENSQKIVEDKPKKTKTQTKTPATLPAQEKPIKTPSTIPSEKPIKTASQTSPTKEKSTSKATSTTLSEKQIKSTSTILSEKPVKTTSTTNYSSKKTAIKPAANTAKPSTEKIGKVTKK